jgi:hypothetical protein
LKTAYLNLRYSDGQRVDAFRVGLMRNGYRIEFGLPQSPRDNDLFLTWNRIGQADQVAKRFRNVLVAENAAWGNGFAGGSWLTLARDRHNTAGMFPVGGSERWDSLGVELAPFRTGGETVILAQRGIGSAPTAMPSNWPADAQKRHGGRIRKHPGRTKPIPLADDLRNCGKAVTWGSGAAIHALMMGIPVMAEMPGWIGEQDNSEAGRLDAFRRLAWAQWRITEIASGDAFEALLNG